MVINVRVDIFPHKKYCHQLDAASKRCKFLQNVNYCNLFHEYLDITENPIIDGMSATRKCSSCLKSIYKNR